MKKKFKIKFFTIFSYILIGIIFLFIPFIKTAKSPFQTEKENYKAIVEIWQIDSFEGGVGSRTSFLRNVASKFTKKHPDVLFLTSSHTVNSAKNLIEKGKYPDVISYGGNTLDLSGKIINLKGYEQLDGGNFDKKRYMLAWCKGGYFEIKRKGATIKQVIVSEGEYNSGNIAKNFSNYLNYPVQSYLPSDAFNMFLIDKNSLFVGTQRDVIRLKNRDIQVEITPILDYCDLYQYVSVIDKGDIKNQYSLQFINYLLSKEIQSTLTQIGMTSCTYNDLYENGDIFNQLNAKKVIYTVSPYMDITNLTSVKNLARQTNDVNEIIKLLKHL